MAEEIGRLFLGLGVIGALLAVAAIVLVVLKVGKDKRGSTIGTAVFALLLYVGTMVTAIIAITDWNEPCAWVALGLSSAAIVFGVISAILAIMAFRTRNEDAIAKQGEDEQPVVSDNFVLLSASANVGTGLWTSICVAFAAIFGVESKNYTKKMERANKAVKARLLKQMSEYPDFVFEDFRIVKDGNLAYTGTVIGTKK